MITEIGPAGSTIAATEFVIKPRTETSASRIKGISLSSGWAVDKIQVQYENSATNPAEIYDSEAFGGGGGNLKSFSLASGDYLTSITGTWGAQAAGYPREEIVSLQFHTHQGNHSQVFGGGNYKKEVEPFTLVAPEGSEIIGLFGAYGSHQNALVRLGLYTRSHTSQNEEAGEFQIPTNSITGVEFTNKQTKDSSYKFTPSGVWKTKPDSPDLTAAGLKGFSPELQAPYLEELKPYQQYMKYQKNTYYALVAVNNTTGVVTEVGQETTIVLKPGETLTFVVNDLTGCYADNSGTLTVKWSAT